MKVALLVAWWNFETKAEGWNWETVNEKTISQHSTREEALQNKPEGHKCLNDGWEEI